MKTMEACTYKLPKKLFVTFFILFNWLSILVWQGPMSSAIIKYLRKTPLPFTSLDLIKTYLQMTGTRQTWNLFAPNHPKCNLYLGGVIHYKDGSQKEFSLPRLANAQDSSKKILTLPPFTNIKMVDTWAQIHHHKFEMKLIDSKKSTLAKLREGVVKYIANVENKDAQNPPVRVELNKYKLAIPKPNMKGEWIDYTALLRNDANYTSVNLIDYTLKPEDFK